MAIPGSHSPLPYVPGVLQIQFKKNMVIATRISADYSFTPLPFFRSAKMIIIANTELYLDIASNMSKIFEKFCQNLCGIFIIPQSFLKMFF